MKLLLSTGTLLLRLIGAALAGWTALLGVFTVWPFLLPSNQRPPGIGQFAGISLAVILISGAAAYAAFRIAHLLEKEPAMPQSHSDAPPSIRPSGGHWKQAVAAVVILGSLWFCYSFWKKCSLLLRKNSEGNVKGRIGTIRSALSIYYGDMEGQYPSDLGGLVPKYLTQIEPSIRGSAARYSPHDMVSRVQYMTSDEFKSGKFTDDGGWAFVRSGSTNTVGTIVVNCTHTDVSGRVWTSY